MSDPTASIALIKSQVQASREQLEVERGTVRSVGQRLTAIELRLTTMLSGSNHQDARDALKWVSTALKTYSHVMTHTDEEISEMNKAIVNM